MPNPRGKWVIAILIAVLGVTTSASAFWFITDMFDQVSKKPQEGEPMGLPEHAIAEDMVDYPIDLPRTELAEMLPKNPYADATTGAPFKHGKVMYDTYCAVCHGLTGMGDGPVAMAGKGIPPFPLLGAAGLSDQVLFAQIWSGNNAIMGPYYWAMSPDEIWQVVTYIRSFAGQ